MKTSNRPLTCDSACEMMFDYIDGELNKEQTASFEEHISSCESCRRELAERREMLSLIKLSEHQTPEALSIGVMEKISEMKPARTPLLSRLKFMPASALVTVCAALTLFVVGHGYIFGSGSTDLAMDAAEVMAGNAAPERGTGTYAEKEAVLFAADAAVPEAVAEAELFDAGEDDGEVYTTTTAALTASSPLMISNYSDLAGLQSSEESENYKSAPSLTADTNSASDTLFLEFDKLYYKLATRVVSQAVLICAEDDIDLSIVDADSIIETETMVVQDSEFRCYVAEADAAKCFSELLRLLDESNSPYRAAIPADGNIETCEIYVLTDSEK